MKIFGVDISINGVTRRNEVGVGSGDNATMQTKVEVVTVSRVEISHTADNNHHDHAPNHNHKKMNNSPKPPRKRERSLSSSASTTAAAATTTSTSLARNTANRRPQPSEERTTKGSGTCPMVLPPGIQQKMRTLEVDVNDEKSKPKLILQKLVYKSDVDKKQARFLIPKGQLRTSEDEFLEQNEWTVLNEGRGKIKVKVIQEAMDVEDREMILAGWPKPKRAGDMRKTPTSYALRTEWNKVKTESKIEKNDVVQVWAFRYGKKDLGLALVNLSPRK